MLMQEIVPVMFSQTPTAWDNARTSCQSTFADVVFESLMSGWPSGVPVVSQSTVTDPLLLVPDPGSATEKLTSEWLPKILMPMLPFKPLLQATRIGQAGRGVSPLPSENGMYVDGKG
jgi:hypothetical protein